MPPNEAMIATFEKMLAAGKDSPLLRFSLGAEYLKGEDAARAAAHLAVAVALDPAYSAAWKLLGKAHAAAGDNQAARTAFEHGMAAATAQGDKQAVKEMQVFSRRLGPAPEPPA